MFYKIYACIKINKYLLFFFNLACDCNSVGALDNLCDISSGQCKCRPQTYGRECDQCEPGSWNYPNCQRCMCHGHTDTCDSRTGVCLKCQGFTEGNSCDRYASVKLNSFQVIQKRDL